MKINFDYYTKDAAFVTKAYQMAIETGARAQISYDPDDGAHNISGDIDHKQLQPLFTYFEDCGFAEHWTEL